MEIHINSNKQKRTSLSESHWVKLKIEIININSVACMIKNKHIFNNIM